MMIIIITIIILIVFIVVVVDVVLRYRGGCHVIIIFATVVTVVIVSVVVVDVVSVSFLTTGRSAPGAPPLSRILRARSDFRWRKWFEGGSKSLEITSGADW